MTNSVGMFKNYDFKKHDLPFLTTLALIPGGIGTAATVSESYSLIVNPSQVRKIYLDPKYKIFDIETMNNVIQNNRALSIHIIKYALPVGLIGMALGIWGLCTLFPSTKSSRASD